MELGGGARGVERGEGGRGGGEEIRRKCKCKREGVCRRDWV